MANTDFESTLEDAQNDLQDWMDDNPGLDASEAISEIADSSVPVYTGDILQYAIDNISLATATPENGPAFDGEYTAVNLIAANIYERIESKLWEYFEQHKDERGCWNCGERYDESAMDYDSDGHLLCEECFAWYEDNKEESEDDN